MESTPRAMSDDDWQFYQHPHGPWSWRKVGPGSRDSRILFPGIVEAIADAVLHGYKPGISHVDMEKCRRAEPRYRRVSRG